MKAREQSLRWFHKALYTFDYPGPQANQQSTGASLPFLSTRLARTKWRGQESKNLRFYRKGKILQNDNATPLLAGQ